MEGSGHIGHRLLDNTRHMPGKLSVPTLSSMAADIRTMWAEIWLLPQPGSQDMAPHPGGQVSVRPWVCAEPDGHLSLGKARQHLSLSWRWVSSEAVCMSRTQLISLVWYDQLTSSKYNKNNFLYQGPGKSQVEWEKTTKRDNTTGA